MTKILLRVFCQIEASFYCNILLESFYIERIGHRRYRYFLLFILLSSKSAASVDRQIYLVASSFDQKKIESESFFDFLSRVE